MDFGTECNKHNVTFDDYPCLFFITKMNCELFSCTPLISFTQMPPDCSDFITCIFINFFLNFFLFLGYFMVPNQDI